MINLRPSPREKEIKSNLNLLQEQILSLNDNLKQLYSNKKIKCISCEESSPLSKWSFINDYWYVAPHGCTSGDYWQLSDDIMIGCPKCSALIKCYRYTLTTPREENVLYTFLKNHSSLFKEQLDNYNYANNLEIIRKEHTKRQSYLNSLSRSDF